MELELLKHSIINLVGNIVVYFLVAIMISWIISACFNIKNDVMPFGWITKLFKALTKVLTPLFKWLFEKLLLLLKVLLKLFLFALERLAVFIADVFRKLFDLIKDPED
ncbi:MAG: hypothetical protein JXQ93_03235 [Flavobacteriaceae bacterium]